MPESPELAALAKTVRDGLAADEWKARELEGARFESTDYLWDTRYLIVKLPSGKIQHTTEFSADLARHIERHDPHRILADVAARRTLLDEALGWEHHFSDCYSDCCPGYLRQPDDTRPCRCTRDARVRAVLTALAAPYQEASS
jgi:uncharacterized protein DUF6221